MQSNNLLGERIEKCRKKAGLTQQQLAAELHVQRQIVSYYENGSRKPDIDMLRTLAAFFEVTTDYLLGLTNAPTVDAELQAICNYTGLSESAVCALHRETNGAAQFLRDAGVYGEAILTTSDFISFLVSDRADVGTEPEASDLLTALLVDCTASCDTKDAPPLFVTTQGRVLFEEPKEETGESYYIVDLGELSRRTLKDTVLALLDRFKDKHYGDDYMDIHLTVSPSGEAGEIDGSV